MTRKTALTLALVFTCAAGLGRCRTRAGPVGIRPGASTEAPAVSRAGFPSGYEIIVTDFKVTEAVPEIDLGRRVSDYLEVELRREFKGTVSRRGPGRAPAAAEDDRNFWKSAGAGLKNAVFLVGTVGLHGEAQKALREEGLPTDGPFRLENRGLAERKRFVLTLECSLIESATGEAILKKSLQERRTYGDVQQSAEFALADLLPVIKAKLFPAIFGRESVEKRVPLLRSPGRVFGPAPRAVFP